MSTTFTLPGNFTLYTASLLWGLGALAGLWMVASKAAPDARSARLDAALVMLACALVGGRMLFAAIHWSYFQAHPAEIVLINLGGLSPSGAAAGMLLGVWIWARYKGSSFWTLVHAMMPIAAALTTAAWLGCWVEGCAYGPVSSAWWALPAPDESGLVASRLPLQLLAGLFSIVWFWVLVDRLAPRLNAGEASGLFVAGIAAVHFALTYLRADPLPIWSGLRWDAWSSFVFIAAGLTMYRLAGAQSQ